MKNFVIENMGIYNSRVARADAEVSQNRETWLFELELPMEEGGVSYINSNNSKIEEEIFICAKPKQIRRTKFPFKCRYIHLKVYDEDLYSKLLKLPDFIRIKNKEYYEKLFEELFLYYNSHEEYSEIMCQSIILKIIYTLFKDTEKTYGRGGGEKEKSVLKAIGYINENLTEELDLERVSKFVSLSPVYFHNCFKGFMGKTLHSYIEEERIKKAVILMQTTDMTLAEVAYECGFSSQSYFSYVFKRRMKRTPRKYIESQNKNYEV